VFSLLCALACGSTAERLEWGPSKSPCSVRNTTAGQVQGLKNTNDGREMYMGIPFASPPTGQNRFRAPQPAPAWSGVKKVDEYSSEKRCLSIGQTGGREDCLYLDVHVPAGAEDTKLPVWVWIYGGGFVDGSKNGGGMYDPTSIMNQHRVVYVAMNYRLDLFGFMAHPAFESESKSGISSGNYGLLDQSFALEWVKKNIANFNGNPDNVMIFGQSAGGMSIDFHIVSQKASAGLFKTAISMSGAPDVAFWQPKKVSNTWAEDWSANIGCGKALGSDEKIRDCLRAANFEELMAQKLPHPSKFSLLYPLFGWVPTIDGFYLTDTPTAMVEAGDWNKQPSMFGVEKNEGTAFAYLLNVIVPDSGVPVTWGDLKSLSEVMIPYNKTKQEMAYNHYAKSSWNWFAQDAAATMITDAIFRCSNRRMMRAIAKQDIKDAPAYYYYTNYEAPLMAAWQALGDFHGFDVVHVFQYDTAVTQVWTGGDNGLADFFRESFFQFGQYGNPLHEGWVRYNLTTELGIAMDGYYKPLNMNHHDPQCDFWDEIGSNLWEGKNGYALVPKGN